MAHQLAGGLAVIIAGMVFDIWDTYDPVFAVAAGFLLFAGLISFAIRERKYSVRYQVPTSIPVESASASAGD
jgi:membrane-bound ClpP family serine protease